MRVRTSVNDLWPLTLFSLYTHFNTMKKKSFGKTLWTKVKLLKMSNFNFFHNVFYAICILKSFDATFQLSSASLNLGLSQNGVLGNGLNRVAMPYRHNLFARLRLYLPPGPFRQLLRPSFSPLSSSSQIVIQRPL